MHTQQNRRLRFEGLDRREVMSATIFESEPNNTAATADLVQLDPVDLAAQVSGIVADRSDQDFFRYRPLASGTVSFSLAAGAPLNAKISVEDISGHKLFESEPRNGVASGSFAVNLARDIVIRVRSQDKSAGAYTLQLSLNSPTTLPTTPPVTPPTTPPGTPLTKLVETEGNDSRATANTADLAAALQLQGSASKKDEDFFALRATTTGTLQIASTSGAVKISIEDASGNKLFESEPKDGKTTGAFSVTAGKTYYVRIRGLAAALDPYLVDLAIA